MYTESSGKTFWALLCINLCCLMLVDTIPILFFSPKCEFDLKENQNLTVMGDCFLGAELYCCSGFLLSCTSHSHTGVAAPKWPITDNSCKSMHALLGQFESILTYYPTCFKRYTFRSNLDQDQSFTLCNLSKISSIRVWFSFKLMIASHNDVYVKRTLRFCVSKNRRWLIYRDFFRYMTLSMQF